MSPGAAIHIEIENRTSAFHPGDLLRAQYRLAADEPCAIRSIQTAVLWQTEGRGDQDLGIHFFERIELDEREGFAIGQMRRLTANLPRSPLSYDGALVKIVWLVRVRMRLHDGQELVGEAPFQLGEVRAPA